MTAWLAQLVKEILAVVGLQDFLTMTVWLAQTIILASNYITNIFLEPHIRYSQTHCVKQL